ncbi:LuxR family two component transcriptional regulator [Rhodopseudomonas thermotolerans]|jgi:FixJ family two-component response regulator|uniref:LuxR family two component transcriptional regulator n=2 Tax=Rhodopseudomonas TaxID=1073 RepID=A0A336JP15_9BRAD|nr:MULTISPECIES: response regulator [Rhodopseudomonas]RED33216.1 LuxR family two component transcriptional regulator [Rhodopseudomonas pentothenatexigens]REF93965.1 LuxR family two component transcriptional regulator [Rhodopseudomonas thermotolerans]SSW91292.1 LuxR family two component transcriptional regulator [Rhodopseudomonas pentothenatexigens]
MTASDSPLIVVVDDDADIRDALAGLFRSIGNRVVSFESAQHLLAAGVPDDANCLILDVRLPGTSGLDLQTMLTRLDIRIPVIFMTGYGDVPMSVRGMKAGAVDFLTKPFREQEMLDAVSVAVARDRRRRESDGRRDDILQRYAALTPREKQVFDMVSAGALNKNVAADLGLSEITVKIHRGRVMKKMGARSFADLVRMAEVIAPQSREAT